MVNISIRDWADSKVVSKEHRTINEALSKISVIGRNNRFFFIVSEEDAGDSVIIGSANICRTICEIKLYLIQMKPNDL